MYEDGYFIPTKEDFKQEWIRESALRILASMASTDSRAIRVEDAVRFAQRLWNKTMEDKE